MVDRDKHIRYIPFCETRVALVDQYSWPEKDTTERICHNGVSHPIYSCQGWISRTLPLDMYPLENKVHPQIVASSQPHFMARDPVTKRIVEQTQMDRAAKRLEGLYTDGAPLYDAYARRRMVLKR